MAYGVLAQRSVALAVLLLAGCANARAPVTLQDPGLARFQQESQQIEGRENRCIRGVPEAGGYDIASIATGGGTSEGEPTQQVTAGRNESLDECRTKAMREKEALSERERGQYHNNAQEERGHKSLIIILTGGLR